MMISIFIRFWMPVLLHMGGIFYLSSRSSFPVDVPPWAFYADKVAHMILFGFLGLLFLRAWLQADWKRFSWKAGIITTGFVALYGITDEMHQMYVPGRTPSIGDFMADVFGCVVMVALMYGYRQREKYGVKRL